MPGAVHEGLTPFIESWEMMGISTKMLQELGGEPSNMTLIRRVWKFVDKFMASW